MAAPRTHYDSENKVWFSKRWTPLFHPDVSLGRAILQVARCHSDKIVQINDNDGTKFTAKDIVSYSIRVAKNLQNLGLKQEDIIGIIASNTRYLAPLAIGSLICGTIFNSLDPSFDKAEIKHMYGLTKPRIIFCDASIYKKVKQSIAELNLNIPIYTVDEKIDEVGYVGDFLLEDVNELFFVAPVLKKGGEQTAAIVCSSGTTGLPKGVCLPHRALLNQALRGFSTSADVLLCFSTIYWMSGLHSMIEGTLAGTTRIITNEPFSPELFLRLIEQYKVTKTFGPPSQIALALECPDINKRDLSSIKMIFCGGSAVPNSVAAAMQKRLTQGIFVIGYGMTEVAGGISGQNVFLGEKTVGSVGQLIPNMELKIIDDNNRNLGVGEIGEICVRPEQKCSYYKNPEANKEVFDNEGWVHTGDLGYVNSDGNIYIVDRKKEIKKYKNFHFYPTEIEVVIAEIPGVVEVCVCGIPDIICTDIPAVAIIKSKDSKLTEDDVYNYVAERLAHYKHLRGGVYFVDSLPKTPSGKILRRKVQELCQELKNKRTSRL